MADQGGDGGAIRGGWRLRRFRGGFCVVAGGKHSRTRRSLGTADPAEAQRRFKEFLTLEATRAASGSKTVGELLSAYAIARAPEIRTADRQASLIRTIKRYPIAALSPGQISGQVCRDYHQARVEEGKSAGTTLTELMLIRVALIWAEKERLIDRAPLMWFPKKPPPRDKRLTLAQIKAMEDAADAFHIRLFIRLAAATGARAGAILGLTWPQVDFDRKLIYLRDPNLPISNKGRATVPINDGALALLKEAREGALTPRVVEWAGKPIKCIRKGFIGAATRAGVPWASPHVIRHSVACILAEAGESMEVIAQYLGHKDTRVTASVYAVMRPGYLKSASNALDY